MVKFIIEAFIYGVFLMVVLPLMATLGFFLISLLAQGVAKIYSLFFEDEESVKF